jgi:O-antigen/teichoic acid export membrane protein
MLSKLNKVLSRLKSSHFTKNILIVMSGTAAAQAIGFALTPIISRLFSPSDFGVFGSFYAVLGVIAAGVTLDYSQAIMLPKEKKDAINLFMLSCVSTALITVCCLIVCLLFPSLIRDLIKTPSAWMLVLLVVAILVNGLNQACQAWCVRVKAFKDTSASQIVRSLSSSGSQSALGFLRGGPAMLVCGVIIGEVLASLNLARVALRDIGTLRRDIGWAHMRRLAHEYRDFPMYSASENVINALSQGLPVLLLTHFYGITVAGAYAFGARMLHAPMGFVLRSLRQVLFQKAAETQNLGGRLMPLYVKITAGLFVLAFIPSLVLFLWAPQLFVWIFGSQWHMAGEFARSLVVWMLFMFCNLPSVLFARIVRIQRLMFFQNIVLLAARALTLIIGGIYFTESYTIMLFAIVGAIMNVIWIIVVGFVLMKKEGHTTWKGIANSMMEG